MIQKILFLELVEHPGMVGHLCGTRSIGDQDAQKTGMSSEMGCPLGDLSGGRSVFYLAKFPGIF